MFLHSSASWGNRSDDNSIKNLYDPIEWIANCKHEMRNRADESEKKNIKFLWCNDMNSDPDCVSVTLSRVLVAYTVAL